MSLSNPRLKKDIMNSDQQYRRNRFRAIEDLAKQAGFDEGALHETEFCLNDFFDLIVEECAKQAESQSRSYTGEHKESTGCTSAAVAIRAFGQRIGNM
jgi:hypothetical protein